MDVMDVMDSPEPSANNNRMEISSIINIFLPLRVFVLFTEQ